MVDTVAEFPIITLAKANDVYKQVIADIAAGKNTSLHPDLFELYKNNYHKAIGQVFGRPDFDAKYFKIATEFNLNTARLAAHKTNIVTNQLLSSYKAKPDEFNRKANATLKQFARWQATEYNTAVARCRTAKQFEQFQAERHLYPNLEWLATRSANPRELHLSFVGIVLPIDDPFWQENQPGNLYNCKCDWKTTDAPTTDAPTKTVKPHVGLEGNPASTGQIFTDKHPYVVKAKIDQFQLADITYQDQVGKFPISVIADKIEIADNVATARILQYNFPEMKIAIRENIIIDRVKNPEYLINGMLADAKRVVHYNGITNGFQKAITQGCKVVIIDFNKHFDFTKVLDVDKVVGRLFRRIKNFEDDTISQCYVIFGNKACLITKDNITKHKLRKVIKGLMP